MARSQKQFVFGLLLASFVLVSVFLYANLDSGTRTPDAALNRVAEVDNLKKVVSDLSSQLKRNRDEMQKMRDDLDREAQELKNHKNIAKENEVYDEKAEADVAQKQNIVNLKGDADHKAVAEEQDGHVGARPDGPELSGNKVAVVNRQLKKMTTPGVSGADQFCSLRANYSRTDTDVQMLDVYKTLAFDNPDGGVWKQGWEIKYDERVVQKERPLQVVVIPHSHCDPGWIKTFEQYYQDQTKNILDGMAKHLGEKEDMRFIYAEMSFFEMWWKEQDEQTRNKVKGYLKSGKFEIVTGGWVMTDEANAHYFSIITELLEGHEWVRNHLDYRPTSHWSIDPFGLSPSLPLLMSAANITNAALQRVHYSIKKHLAKNKQLEFMWRQMWGSHGAADVRAHVFPFYSYDVPHTCGPEPAVCCQFDFRRLPGGGHSCPWNIPPQEITDDNLANRAFMIYDQYRKKSQLYSTNVLLIPLGDDFRYDGDFEWNAQHTNYHKLFEYMNSKTEWNVKAQFGTLSDYFKLLGEELNAIDSKLPVLTGDFFTYADRDDHYWSGYFTSRPFYKQMDRILQHYLRSAEIAFTLASMQGFSDDTVYSSLVSARRALSLFQHHDGVTGTAKDPVVEDYGKKMLAALKSSEEVLSSSLQALLGEKSSPLLMHEKRSEHDVLPQQNVYRPGQSVVVFNTLSRPRSEPICITVSSIKCRIDKDIEQQISPVLTLNKGGLKEASGMYELCFVQTIEPFAIETFSLTESDSLLSVVPAVKTNNDISLSGFKVTSVKEDVTIENGLTSAVFDINSGFLKKITTSGSDADLNLKFVKYGARGHKKISNGGGDDLSGAYLFLPDGDATPLPIDNHHFVVIDGPIVKKVYVAAHKDVELLQKYSLFKDQYDIEIETEVDIRSKLNYELAMRFDTSVKSGDDLFTDLNGMQMIRRVRMLDKLPMQAHFYPMPGSAFIEDNNARLNLLGAQALGVASLKEGQLEVMLDRRLNQDDGRGLFQGVLDNKRTVSRFRVLLEPVSEPSGISEARVGFLSTAAHSSSLELHYPWVRMLSTGVLPSKSVKGLAHSLPCDLHIVSLRTMAKPTDYDSTIPKTSAAKEAALILHRTLPDCRSKLKLANDCASASSSVVLKDLLPLTKSSHEASLTLLYEEAKDLSSVNVEPQQLRTVKITW